MSTEFKSYLLIDKQELSHDVRKFTFALDTPRHCLGLPIGRHMSVSFVDSNGKRHLRSYTPVTDDDDLGICSFVVKIYRPMPPKFPNGGIMSQHLDSLKVGEDTLQMKGPKGHVTYHGMGKFTVKPLGQPVECRSCRSIGMMAGGTGITPMLQLLHAIFRNAQDKTTVVKLLYANQTPDDILVRSELETLAENFPDRFSLHYTVDKATDENWKYSTGFIDKDMIRKHVVISNSHDQQQFFMCGPPPMIKFACLPNLKELGYTEKDWVVY